jgi:hypothetical protein
MLRLRSTVLVTVEGTALGENLLVTPRCRARVSPEPFLQELRRRPHDLRLEEATAVSEHGVHGDKRRTASRPGSTTLSQRQAPPSAFQLSVRAMNQTQFAGR